VGLQKDTNISDDLATSSFRVKHVVPGSGPRCRSRRDKRGINMNEPIGR